MVVAPGLCWGLVIRKQRAELHRGNVQGVVFEGAPEWGKKLERVRTGSARSAGKLTQQSVNRRNLCLCLNPALFLSFPFTQLSFKSGIMDSLRFAFQEFRPIFHIWDHFLSQCPLLFYEFFGRSWYVQPSGSHSPFHFSCISYESSLITRKCIKSARAVVPKVGLKTSLSGCRITLKGQKTFPRIRRSRRSIHDTHDYFLNLKASNDDYNIKSLFGSSSQNPSSYVTGDDGSQ